jgi:hypothetical protein
MWGSSLKRRRICSLTLLLDLAKAIILGLESLGNLDFILLSQSIPVLIYPTRNIAQLNPQALGSLFVASYDSKGYNGGILSASPSD